MKVLMLNLKTQDYKLKMKKKTGFIFSEKYACTCNTCCSTHIY